MSKGSSIDAGNTYLTSKILFLLDLLPQFAPLFYGQEASEDEA
jgi:hypothetical protein